ncbi:MAG: Pup--protein ligase [Arcanobacterium sp.]|nr:Pup--protein ligase [Arcanobacterium sp.]
MMLAQKRLYGIETEYGITCAATDGGPSPIEPEESANYLFADLVSRTKSTNAFLGNGARLYLDVGAHPEYASAECASLSELITNDRAGDLIFAKMAENANQRLAADGISGRIHLFKNNHDVSGNSFGCHENYLVRRRRDYRARIDELVPFFVTRQILVGAGYLCVNSETGEAHYEISQRASQMWDAVSAASTRSRPMINTRDEPHGDVELYRRMHVIVGDSNISDATNALKIGMTEAVLNYLEAGKRLKRYQLVDPMQAIRQTSLDLSGKALLETLENGTITALELQEYVFTEIYSYYESAGLLAELDEFQKYVFDLWRRSLTALSTDSHENVATEIDWIAKWNLLQSYQDKLGVELADSRLRRLDLAWHDVTSSGLRTRLENSGGLRKLVSNEAIETATTTPPQSTRAKLRGDFITAAQQARRDYLADWSNLRLFTADGARSVVLKDPFSNEDLNVAALHAEIAKN